MRTMTPRERVLAALHGQPTDQVPFTLYENKLPPCAVERRLRNEGLCIVCRNVPVVTSCTPNCVHRSCSYTDGGRSRVRREIETPVGLLTQVDEPAGYTSWTLEHLFKGPEDYAPLLAMVRDTRYAPNYAAYAEAERWMGDDVILRGGVGAQPLHQVMIQWMGVETFAMEWSERQDEVLTLVRALEDNLRQVFPLLADSPITHANFSGNEVPEVMGPVRYREFCLPLIQECGEIFHRKGKLLGSHMDGNNRAWAADLAGSAFDYIEAFTPAPDTDLTLREALDAWPDKVLWINFPSSLHLASLETIRRTTREILATAAGSNRLILGITEDIPPDRWQENLLAISEEIGAAARRVP